VHRDPFTEQETVLQIKDGTVAVDTAAACRRTLSLTVPPLQQYADALAAPGGEITITQTVRFINRATETVPLGVFVVDEDSFTYGRDGQISITGRDRMVTVQRNKFRASQAASVPTNPAWAEIKRLIEGGWPNAAYPFPGWAQVDTTATTPVGPLLWADGDRDAAWRKLAEANTVQVFFRADGLGVLRRTPAPRATATPAWIVRPGQGGALLGAERTRPRSELFNAVEVTSTAPGLYLPPATAANTNPADPYSIHGPLGYRPRPVSSSTFYNVDQMDLAAMVRLSRLLGRASDLSLEVAPNGALEGDDVLGILTPDAATDADPERRVVTSFTVPLTPAGRQSIGLRSIMPTGYEDTLAELGF
jgi:hypothetical protein